VLYSVTTAWRAGKQHLLSWSWSPPQWKLIGQRNANAGGRKVTASATLQPGMYHIPSVGFVSTQQHPFLNSELSLARPSWAALQSSAISYTPLSLVRNGLVLAKLPPPEDRRGVAAPSKAPALCRSPARADLAGQCELEDHHPATISIVLIALQHGVTCSFAGMSDASSILYFVPSLPVLTCHFLPRSRPLVFFCPFFIQARRRQSSGGEETRGRVRRCPLHLQARGQQRAQ